MYGTSEVLIIRTTFRVSAPRFDHHGVVAVSPNNQWLAVGEPDGRIRVLALATLTEQFSVPGPSEGISALVFSPDSKLLASASGFIDSTVRMSLDFPTEARRLEGHAAWVRGLWPSLLTVSSWRPPALIKRSVYGMLKLGWKLQPCEAIGKRCGPSPFPRMARL